MHTDHLISNLAKKTAPKAAVRADIHKKILQRIEPDALKLFEADTTLSTAKKHAIKDSILHRISTQSGDLIDSLRSDLSVSGDLAMRIKHAVVERLMPVRTPVLDRVLKWTAATAAFTLIIQLSPILFLTPTTQAGSSIELIPLTGKSSITVAGIRSPLIESQKLTGPTLIETEDGEATLVLHDDAVVRLAPHSAIKIHDLSDRPEPSSIPTISYVRGTAWLLSLLPPTVDPVSVEFSDDELLYVHEGSVSISSTSDVIHIDVFDKRASMQQGADVQYAVLGESISVTSDAVSVTPFGESRYDETWVMENLNRDAVHRKEVAELQKKRQEENAGILPTSIFYPAKRFAEHVDILFTLGDEARAQKRLQQAETRLNEALVLIEEGDPSGASGAMLEYRDTLLTLASGTGDNIVKFMLQKQVQEASVALANVFPEDETYVLKEAVYDVVASVPDAQLTEQDIQGYVLLDKLSSINRNLSQSGTALKAVDTYNEIQPYLTELLSDENTLNPLLKKEAQTLLVTTVSSIEEIQNEQETTNDTIAGLKDDITQYLPPESEQARIRASEQDLQNMVEQMVNRIFTYDSPRGRYNQLYQEMRSVESHPDRGTILRRLYEALPENGLAQYVRTEIREFSNELHQD